MYKKLTVNIVQTATIGSNNDTLNREIKPSPTPTAVITKVILTGDIMLGRKVMIESQVRDDPYFPFRELADDLTSADLVFVNLENPIISDCPRHSDGFKFCTTYEIAEGLAYSGVDVVTLANNHSSNYGQAGIDETVEYLNDKGIKATGLSNLVIITVNETKFGFLGFDFTVNEPDKDDYGKVIESSQNVDILIVGVHWGVEYTRDPIQKQRIWAKKIVENGADIVVGHHPHWVQTMECIAKTNETESGVSYEFSPAPVRDNLVTLEDWEGRGCRGNEAPVFYSLGNFIFDQMWSEETKKGVLVELEFEANNIVRQKVNNTYIQNWGQVNLVNEN